MSWTELRRLPLIASAVAVVAVGAYGWFVSRAGGAAVFLALAAGALAWVIVLVFRAAGALAPSQPDAEPRTRPTTSARRRVELEREKQRLLKAIKELEFDHEMGKISDGDFREISAQYRARAMRAMRLLDEAGADYRKLVARDVAERRAAQPGAPTPAVPARPTCGGCATVNDDDAAFCKKCGRALAPAERAS
jgi:hypothetical protein